MTPFLERIAGAPITWGVDGSPGWGHLMHPDRVMSEMVATGLSATELGPDGFLPTDPSQLVDYLSGYDLQLVGGFVPALLYRPDKIDAVLEYAERAARQLAAGGSKVIVVGPSSHLDGYDQPVDLALEEWRTFFANLQRLQGIAGDIGVATAVHPHWGMAVATAQDTHRLLDSSDAGLCLDTGHLFLAGADPVEIAKAAGNRVRHVHLKDLSAEAALAVRSGSVPFRQATIDGMFTPVGSGDVDIEGVIRYLEGIGYDGWYVLEQDCALVGEPPVGEGPMSDAEASVQFLRDLAATL
ncbi:MAG: TIM barrel protein [Acidimicrobiia bacterium]|nr:TIM barrel protein [Acidimicrobiia bacterium]NNF62766.1 TIM barrel protein [Acidimicrobiia bacterium]